MNSQWWDCILILTVLIQVVAEPGEDAALGLAQAKFGVCSTHGVQSAVPHLLSPPPPASGSAVSLKLWKIFTAPLVQPLGFHRTTARIYPWAVVLWHLLLPFLFSLLLYNPQMCASRQRPPLKQHIKYS